MNFSNITMQLTTTLSVGLLAALASASQHVPQHFHHRRQYNTSVPSTTLTVYATEVYTITSCAATVTDCPARASESTVEQVITATVKAYTVRLGYQNRGASLIPSRLFAQWLKPHLPALLCSPHTPPTTRAPLRDLSLLLMELVSQPRLPRTQLERPLRPLHLVQSALDSPPRARSSTQLQADLRALFLPTLSVPELPPPL